MNNLMEELTALREQDVLKDIDLELCRFLQEQHRDASEDVLLAASLVSYLYRQGDVCLLLERYAGRPVFDEAEVESTLRAPALSVWKERLVESPMVGRPGDFKPLILEEEERLYLHKLWHYEDSLARELIKRSEKQLPHIDNDLLKDGLKRLFPEPPDNEVDWQRVAAATSVKNKLSVISGGPGTGKTSTVVRILGLIAEQYHKEGSVPSIALAAPTGKAAARLKDSILSAREELQVSDRIKDVIPDQTMTLHQLLGARRHTSSFKHDQDNPIPYDLVVVDEASMVDQALMSKLMMALLDETRLILLGDKDQLASVEAGSVLGDICSINNNEFSGQTVRWLQNIGLDIPSSCITNNPKALTDHITLLTKSYRFGTDSGIAKLAESINAGDAEAALQALESDEFTDTSLISAGGSSDLDALLREQVSEYFRAIISSSSAEESLKAFNQFRILSPHRRGPRGVTFLNQYVEKILQEADLIPKYKKWYPGKPVIVNVNDYSLGLHNGDTGICLPDQEGAMKVYFRDEDKIRAIAPGRLPDHSTAFVLTVHKSQGSEFKEVLFILPKKTSKVLSRELIYTATTRARTKIRILSDQSIFCKGIEKKLQRSSGLRDRLWS